MGNAETPEAATGAQLLTRALSAAGVRTLFSLSGNQIMPIYDACLSAGIRIVHVRHEAAAVYMAEAHAQLTGEVGVALVTAAPGFANALSPLFSARLSESPILLLSGDSPLSQDGMGAFQELGQTEISAPLVKASSRPQRASELATAVAQAIRMARSGRPGPVHMALAFDVLCAEVTSPSIPASEAFEPVPLSLCDEAADHIGGLIARAERPVIVTGPAHNRSRADGLTDRLESVLNVPVVCMESPRGLRDPSLGAFAEIIAEADLVVLLGKAADFTTGFLGKGFGAADAKFVIVDPDTGYLDRARAACGGRLAFLARADVAAAAAALVARGRASSSHRWLAAVREAVGWRGERVAGDGAIHPAALCDEVNRLIERADEAILVCDGGEFGQWAQAFCTAKRRIINGPSGAIGGGLCYAVAAKIAYPEATVVVLMGDGTAGFHFVEFETAAREGADIVAVIGNDSRWNAEHQIQLRDYGADRLIGCELSDRARYDRAASGFGCHGEYVETAEELSAALERAAACSRPTCVNVIIDSLAAPVFLRGAASAVTAH
ncbi:thiamine pyrophosphate-binding protein [Aurantimonas marianensis]|uniref:Thiamine pyrophosphate-binding protein n=1 Tax=Aurantimonas marianensis TaxID=2920428 RepID=A0A9X2HG92_9HYPH|nr:thiamine pyrophosphate-binding protein [Aurantimonas marianensis]MCP3057004.1 thiamine pyrophosphate-binding protein [Aurantimonas marianensis]